MNKPELLAPAGNWEALEAVVAAGADAVYLGGKRLNMRQWRADLNFSDSQIQEALDYAHRKGVKIYVTVNNLYFESELDELASHLEFLEGIGVDALIVQDLAVVRLVQEMGLTRPLHASVQVGLSNAEELELFKRLGFSRAIVSKDLSIEQIWGLSLDSDLELECFVHGDLCAAHTGQCLLSSLVFGESSNRGRCMKPCRWRYRAVAWPKSGPPINLDLAGSYLLACKDLCLYPLLPDLVQAGIVCFKIEGRMREGAYLGPLVGAYRRALDRYLSNPVGYSLDRQEWEALLNRRIRNFTTGRALGDPGTGLYDFSGVREPHFSTRPIEHQRLSDLECNRPRWSGPAGSAPAAPLPHTRLSVRVGSPAALEQALAAGADLLYIGGETLLSRPTSWGYAQIKEALAMVHRQGAQLIYATPRVAHRREINEYRDWLRELRDLGIDGVLAANWGILQLAREIGGLRCYGDYPLNLASSRALEVARSLGLEQAAVSLEIPMEQLTALLDLSELPVEVMVHGHLTGMVLNQDLASLLSDPEAGNLDHCSRLYLEDEAGERYRVEVDQYRRTHLLLDQPLCLLPYLPFLIAHRPAALRLEMQYTDPEPVGRLVEIYRRHLELALNDPAGYQVSPLDWDWLKELNPAGYTAGALSS